MKFPSRSISSHRHCMVSLPKSSLVSSILIDFFSFAVITTSTPEKADGLKALENAIEKIETTIKKLDGHFAIQMAVSELFATKRS